METRNRSILNTTHNSTCCTSIEKENKRKPLHYKMAQFFFTIAALPATIDAVASPRVQTSSMNSMALLNTARLMREQRLKSRQTSTALDDDDVRKWRIQRNRYGESDFDVNMGANSSLRNKVAKSKDFGINQIIPGCDMILSEALFDDDAIGHVLASQIYNEGNSNRVRHSSRIPSSVKEDSNSMSKKSKIIDFSDAEERNKKRSGPDNVSPMGVKKINTRDISTIMSTKKALHDKRKRNTFDDGVDGNISSTARVSHEEELQLAHIIQKGVELNRLKEKFETKHQRVITRQEWTDLAKLGSPRELRRMVSNYRKAKNKLVMANMGLVHAVVRKRNNSSIMCAGVSYEELIQEGSLGLLRAAELFDPSKGLRFSTYATIWIKGVIGNSSVGEAITLPLREKNKWKKIQKAVEELSIEKNSKTSEDVQLMSRPTHEEIASHGGMRSDEVRKVMSKMKRTRNILSLDYQYNTHSRGGSESQLHQGAFSNDKNLMDDVDLAEKMQFRADVVIALTRNLDEREVRLMGLRYGLKDGKTRTIEECAEIMGISRARVQQLAVGCLKKLREADDAESLQEYLLSVA